MGNQNTIFSSKSNRSNCNTPKSKLSKITKKILQLHTHGIKQGKRVVFISLLGLYRSWQHLPSETMNHCLLILPLKQIWLYQPLQYVNEIRSSFLCEFSMFSDPSETGKFIEMIKLKDRQGLLICMLDYMGSDEYPVYYSEKEKCAVDSVIDPRICSFWYHLSMKLTTLNDICTGNQYQPLILDIDWYKNQSKFVSKYEITSAEIIAELYSFNMKYRTIQELLYQSNQNLEPVIMYGQNLRNIMRQITDADIVKLYTTEEIINHDNVEGDWFISVDYDPDDICNL